ncbi:MAG TPA: MBL fold metallo-hydrolase [Gemmatirosa sp.]
MSGFPPIPQQVTPTPVVPGVWDLPISIVHAYLIADGDAPDAPLALVDTGLAGSAPAILSAVTALGRRPEDVRWIVATHLHVDHTGSLAELKRLTGAEVLMHAVDATAVAAGVGGRTMHESPAPGSAAFVAGFDPRTRRIEPCATDRMLADGDELPFAGGGRVVHAPGHAAGQVTLLLPHAGGLLVAADALGNGGNRLGWSLGYEDIAQGVASIERLAGLTFEHAVFGHGDPIVGGADAQFRRAARDVFGADSA